ncbi:substrate-binding periplasmic protein [Alicyclobacillus mengziensis]|nr:transporter substrate-binding domain-containing protein [Alicyclobacillus mengziensis]
MSKISIPVMVATVGIFTLAGCGTSANNNANSGVTTNSAGTGSSSGTGSNSTSQNDLLSQVESTHTLSVAVSAFAPQDFQSPTTKQWTGYDINILKGFAKTLGATLKVNAMPFNSSIQAVADKRDDLTIDIYYTKQRAQVLDFSRPMLNYNDVIAVNSKNPAISSTNVSSLKGKKVAVVLGSAEVAEAKNIPGAHVKQYNSVAESFLALSQGRVAADIQPDTDVSWAKKQNPNLNIKLLGTVPSSIAPPIQSLRGYYGVPKGSYSTRFLDKLNAYLKQIVTNGTEQKILDKYGMSNPVFLKGLASAPNTYSGN